MEKLLLITPPFLQINCPYPATAYLKGYLTRAGYAVEQCDLSIETIEQIFSAKFLQKVFETWNADTDDENIRHIYAQKDRYCATIDSVMAFLRGTDPTLAHRICSGTFLPQAGRFKSIGDTESAFGMLGSTECARYICTLYLQDLSDYIRATISENFEIVRYGEQLAAAIETFDQIEPEITAPENAIEREMTELLEKQLQRSQPTVVGFNVPFPGCLLAALRCARYIRETRPEVRIVLGGGYPTTELRNLSDKRIFKYVDYIVLDDGEIPLERILSGGELVHTYTRDGYHSADAPLSHAERGCPDFSGLPHDKYVSLLEVTNPMHRLWTDGRWNKMVLAHGCYWARCAFCDISLDYIGHYDRVPAPMLVDWMERIISQTGNHGFHFTDEAAPPKILKELSLEILRRGLNVTWWTNIRFEKSYTEDLCRLMAAAGCIAVSGGLEVASDRLLKLMNKGVTIHQAACTLRNLSRAGILSHTYLMYGFPTETLQETVDSLEVVRQLFANELVQSAFWHRYAMTVHSPSGQHPELFGVRRRNDALHPFANNEIRFVENRNYNLKAAGESLNTALQHYMYGYELERPVHKWFTGKVPVTTVEPTLIADCMIEPDAARLYDEKRRIIWIGSLPQRDEEGIVLFDQAAPKHLKFKPEEADFLMDLIRSIADLSRTTTLSEAAELFQKYSESSFLALYLSKKWDILRSYGMLHI